MVWIQFLPLLMIQFLPLLLLLTASFLQLWNIISLNELVCGHVWTHFDFSLLFNSVF